MKRIISLIAVLNLIILTFSGCVFDRKKTALTISGTDIDEQIYYYYLDRIEQRPSDYGLDSGFKSSEARDKAIDECVKYLAYNTYFADAGLTLSVADKVSVADSVNNLWIRSEEHYKSIGVSRQALTKIITAETYRDAIFTYLYDSGSDDESAENMIKAYFYRNFVAFRSICAYFTADDGSGRITEQERLALINSVNSVSSASGKNSDSFTDACSEAGFAASDIAVLEKGSSGYPDGFFEEIYAMSPDEVKILEYDENVFAVRKEDIEQLGEGLYSSYRSYCIQTMFADEWSAYMDEYVSLFKIEKVNV